MNKNLGNLIDLNKNLDKIAIICEDQKITYRALDILANSVSYSLLKKGIKKGDRVAIISLNSIDYIIMYLGILKLGAVAVLINVKSPQSQIDYILKDSDCKIVLKDITDLEIPLGIEYLFNTPIEESDPAVILYTSGSTSYPKKIIISHNRKWEILEKCKNNYADKRIVLLASPLYHGHGLTIMSVVLTGHSTLVLLPHFDSKKFIKSIEQYKINSFSAVPTMLSLILNEKDLIKNTDLNSVIDINLHGASFKQQLIENIKKIFYNAKVNNRYGSTELGSGLFIDHPTLPTPSMSVGYPNPSIQYRIINDILQIKSPSMIFKDNNDINKFTEDGFYITNDLFEIDEQGFYYYIGRADDMFTNGGNNIYPRQIEIILETHPFIKEAAIIGLEDDIKGMKPYAFVTLSKNVTEEEIKEYVLKQLPTSHCPKRIWTLKEFPLLSINKIDKVKLKEIAKSNI
jgi:acyl-CoA synthetase (AMP-forming)/AMP-acid ligase II